MLNEKGTLLHPHFLNSCLVPSATTDSVDTKTNKTQSSVLRACWSGTIQISCHKCLSLLLFSQEIFLNFTKIFFSIFYLRQWLEETMCRSADAINITIYVDNSFFWLEKLSICNTPSNNTRVQLPAVETEYHCCSYWAVLIMYGCLY